MDREGTEGGGMQERQCRADSFGGVGLYLTTWKPSGRDMTENLVFPVTH